VSTGSVLIAAALVLVVGAYLARPFRLARAQADLGQAIEGWVAQARVDREDERGHAAQERTEDIG
jgi:hypothetical protein